jgi:hypothetical protein
MDLRKYKLNEQDKVALATPAATHRNFNLTHDLRNNLLLSCRSYILAGIGALLKSRAFAAANRNRCDQNSGRNSC